MSTKDPTEPLRIRAGKYAGVDKGTACTQTSFKANKKAFLYVGQAAGRHKAMFKLRDSLPEAKKLAAKQPDRFEVGSTNWVTARFTPDEPMPRKLWEKWLDESYGLCAKPPGRSPSKRKAAAKKKTAKRKVANQKTPKKKTPKKKAPNKKAAKRNTSARKKARNK